MSCNSTWIWAQWLYHAQESSWCMVGFTAYLAVDGFSTSYLSSWIFIKKKFCQVKRRFHNGDRAANNSTHKMDQSPLSPSSLGSSRTAVNTTSCHMFVTFSQCSHYHPTFIQLQSIHRACINIFQITVTYSLIDWLWRVLGLLWNTSR